MPIRVNRLSMPRVMLTLDCPNMSLRTFVHPNTYIIPDICLPVHFPLFTIIVDWYTANLFVAFVLCALWDSKAENFLFAHKHTFVRQSAEKPLLIFQNITAQLCSFWLKS